MSAHGLRSGDRHRDTHSLSIFSNAASLPAFFRVVPMLHGNPRLSRALLHTGTRAHVMNTTSQLPCFRFAWSSCS